MTKKDRIKELRKMIMKAPLSILSSEEVDYLTTTSYMLGVYEDEKEINNISNDEIDRISVGIYNILG